MVKRKTKKLAYTGSYVSRPKKGKTTLEAECKTRKPKTFKTPDYLSEDQKKQLTKNEKYYNSYTNDQLKELLMKNRQIKTGTREELLSRCAEMKLLGGLRKCPKCKKGNLKFKIKTGEYFCEDDNSCNYKSSTCERNNWIE